MTNTTPATKFIVIISDNDSITIGDGSSLNEAISIHKGKVASLVAGALTNYANGDTTPGKVLSAGSLYVLVDGLDGVSIGDETRNLRVSIPSDSLHMISDTIHKINR